MAKLNNQIIVAKDKETKEIVAIYKVGVDLNGMSINLNPEKIYNASDNFGVLHEFEVEE
jgi:hypothetical protein